MRHLYADFIDRVAKPARYLGGEYLSVVKKPEDVDARVVLAFPDVYEIGMSHLGTKIIYSLLSAYLGVADPERPGGASSIRVPGTLEDAASRGVAGCSWGFLSAAARNMFPENGSNAAPRVIEADCVLRSRFGRQGDHC